jgi:hypothetical protein
VKYLYTHYLYLYATFSGGGRGYPTQTRLVAPTSHPCAAGASRRHGQYWDGASLSGVPQPACLLATGLRGTPAATSIAGCATPFARQVLARPLRGTGRSNHSAACGRRGGRSLAPRGIVLLASLRKTAGSFLASAALAGCAEPTLCWSAGACGPRQVRPATTRRLCLGRRGLPQPKLVATIGR